METFSVTGDMINYVFMIIGDIDDVDLDWSQSPVLAVAPTMLAIGGEPREIRASFTVSEEHFDWDDIFFAHSIPVGEEGITLVDIIESNGEPFHDSDFFYKLPWTGMTTFQFRAPEGYVDDMEGTPIPKSLEVLVTPAPENHSTYMQF